ncbi:MAG: hypothetical protein ACI8P0_001301 [Planctomycetaceae bacterium]|jgi:hypothetical protein
MTSTGLNFMTNTNPTDADCLQAMDVWLNPRVKTPRQSERPQTDFEAVYSNWRDRLSETTGTDSGNEGRLTLVHGLAWFLAGLILVRLKRRLRRREKPLDFREQFLCILKRGLQGLAPVLSVLRRHIGSRLRTDGVQGCELVT